MAFSSATILLRMFRDLSERLLSIKVLAAGNEPNFGEFKVFHEVI